MEREKGSQTAVPRSGRLTQRPIANHPMNAAVPFGTSVAHLKCVCHFKEVMNMLQRFWPGPLLPSTTDTFWTSVNGGLEKAGDGFDALTGDMGTKAGNGTVTEVDRSTKHITIKYANGKTEPWQSVNSFTAHSSRVIVHYADESGRQVARFFKPAH